MGPFSPEISKLERYEVLVFLFLIVPSMILSFFVARKGGLGFVFTAFSVMLRDLSLVSLILFFLWHNTEPLEVLGWTFKHAGKDILLGIALFFPMFFGGIGLDSILQRVGLSPPPMPAPSFLAVSGRAEMLLAFVLVVVVAFAEEIIFRGYLLLRFRALGTLWAAILSAIIFSLGHGYEGTSGVVTVGFMGLVFAVVYFWRKSLGLPSSCISSRILPVSFWRPFWDSNNFGPIKASAGLPGYLEQ